MDEQLSEEISQFLPWIDSFHRALCSYRSQFGISEAMIAQVASIKASMEGAVQAVSLAEANTWEAGRAVSVAEAALNDAERRHAEALDALRLAVNEKGQAIHDAALHLRPLAVKLQRVENTPISIQEYQSDSGPSPMLVTRQPGSGGSQVRLIPPSNLVAHAQSNRVTVLRWDSSGTDPNVQYLIEAAVGTIYRGVASEPESSSYKPVSTVLNSTMYSHQVERVPPGVRVKYRVRARQDALVSGYSNEVIVTCK
jgi:hypothetical protein